MSKLNISDDLKLPLEAVTQTFAIVARKRVGKTYTASVMAEEFIKAKIPIVVLDPTGAWFGLRSSADGKSDGFPVVIIGGSHGDVPMDEHAGKIIADLVVDHPGFYIVDFSLTESEAAQDRFATEFGSHFYRRKESSRFPMHLFIDEADSFMPQRPFPGQQRMLGAYDTIVRRGGIRGIGVTLITQRPAVLNKNALTQAETLIALQMSGAQDIDAVEHWVRIHGTKEQRDVMIGSLASLQQGEAWVWSPSWLEIFKRVKIRKRETFNSSATPKAGEKTIIAPKLASVDIERLGERIKTAAETIKANDPGELKRTISKLRQELSGLQKAAPATREKIKEVPVLSKSAEKFLAQVPKDLEAVRLQVIRAQGMADSIRASFDKFTSEIGSRAAAHRAALPSRPPAPQARAILFKESARGDARPTALPVSNGELSKAERGILRVLANYPAGKTRREIGVIAVYKHSGGGFNNAVGSLRTKGYIEGSDPLRITEGGLGAYGPVEPLPSGPQLYDYWQSHPDLGRAEREILRVLVHEAKGGAWSKEEIAPVTQSDRGEPYEANGGGFNNAIGKLRAYELIAGKGTMAAAKEFFE